MLKVMILTIVLLLKGGIGEPEEAAISRQRLGKHSLAAIDTHTATEELL
jgi:hypothetical protein